MIFGYEALSQGRGREEVHPTSRDLFVSCSEPALFWVSEGFTQLFVKSKPTLIRGARGWAEVLLRSCRAGVKPTSMAGAQHSTPLQLHFSPHLFLDTAHACIHHSSLKRQAIPPLCLPFPLDTRSEVQIFRNEVNHLPPGFCKHGPSTCPQTGVAAHLLQTFLPLLLGAR